MKESRKVLIIVENLSVPFDRRVWMEATTLEKAGFQVSVICPKGNGFDKDFEVIEGVSIYGHPLLPEVSSVTGYLREYTWAVSWQFRLANQIWRKQGFNVTHICNPPDLLLLTAIGFKIFKGVRVIFDHHDLFPEMYVAKYNRKDIFYTGLEWAEKSTYITADVAISTNESHKKVALVGGKKKLEQVFVVRSAPDLSWFSPVLPKSMYRRGRDYLVSYMGVIPELYNLSADPEERSNFYPELQYAAIAADLLSKLEQISA